MVANGWLRETQPAAQARDVNLSLAEHLQNGQAGLIRQELEERGELINLRGAEFEPSLPGSRPDREGFEAAPARRTIHHL